MATENLTFDSNKKGAGVFSFDKRLVLTKKGFSKSKWNLDSIFKDVKISYHSKNSWKKGGYFQSTHKGQEFVVHCNQKVEDYIIDLLFF